MDYSDIIKRLREATGPDRELDEAVCLATNAGVFELRWSDKEPGHVWLPGCGSISGIHVRASRYTASIDAALELVETLLPRGKGWANSEPASAGWRIGFERGIVARPEMQSWAAWVRPHGHDAIEAEATTAPLAILIALFSALSGKPEVTP